MEFQLWGPITATGNLTNDVSLGHSQSTNDVSYVTTQ